MTLGSVRPTAGPEDRRTFAELRAGLGPWRATRRRHRMPLVTLGGLLVIVCVLTFAYGTVRLGDRVQVFVVARPVAAGQAIAAADLKTVSAAQDPNVPLIPATQPARVLGRTAVVPLLPGTLLTPTLVGAAAFPPVNKVTASVAVKPGQYPQGLTAGAQVLVYVSANPSGAGGQPVSGTSPGGSATSGRLKAAVLGVDLSGDGQGATVITLLLDASDSARLAAAPPSGVVLMQTSPEGA
jgi:hypothetical protein